MSSECSKWCLRWPCFFQGSMKLCSSCGLARQCLNLLLSHTFQTCTLFHQGNARNYCGGRGHWAKAEARVCCQLEAFWMGSGGSLSSFEAIISFHFFTLSLFWCSPPTKLDRAWPASGWLVGREIHFCLLSKMQSFPWWSTGDPLSDHLILWVPWRWLKPCFLSAQKSMTWPPCLSTTLKTMRCLVVMCTMSGCQVWGSILKTGDSIGKSLFCLKAFFQALSKFHLSHTQVRSYAGIRAEDCHLAFSEGGQCSCWGPW